MSEVANLVVPILQKIQSELADVKRDLAEVKRVQAEHSQRFEHIDNRFESMEIYLAYATGIEPRTSRICAT